MTRNFIFCNNVIPSASAEGFALMCFINVVNTRAQVKVHYNLVFTVFVRIVTAVAINFKAS